MNLKCLFLGHAWGEWERLVLTQRRVCRRCGKLQTEFKK